MEKLEKRGHSETEEIAECVEDADGDRRRDRMAADVDDVDAFVERERGGVEA